MRVPLSLRVYGAIAFVPFIRAAIDGDLLTTDGLLALVMIGGLVIALWRASRVAWILFLAFESSLLVSRAFFSPPWWAVLLSIAAVACLVTPSAYRFVWRRSITTPHAEPSIVIKPKQSPGDLPDPRLW